MKSYFPETKQQRIWRNAYKVDGIRYCRFCNRPLKKKDYNSRGEIILSPPQTCPCINADLDEMERIVKEAEERKRQEKKKGKKQ